MFMLDGGGQNLYGVPRQNLEYGYGRFHLKGSRAKPNEQREPVIDTLVGIWLG